MVSEEGLSRVARRLRDVIEPVVAQVYFAPECHDEYVALGFAPSRITSGSVALPDGPAYFTSRGSCLGQVPGELVAAAFAVFNPAAVVPSVAFGWSLTNPATIAAARTRGGVGQLRRIVGDSPAGLARAKELLTRATDGLRPEGRPLYAGLLSLGLPGDPLADLWRLGDLLREYRGDAHTAAWVSAGLDATEIGLLTELYWRIPMRTYVRSRAWSDDQLDAAQDRLRQRGLLEGDGFSDVGRTRREEIEVATDRQMRPAVEALGDDADELFAILSPWGDAIRAAGGYPGSPRDLTRARRQD
jgi:hypothetical protein